MIDRTTKLRWRRRYKRSRRQVEDYSQQAEDQLDKHFFRRLNKLGNVRRFIVSWILLLVLIGGVTIAQTYSLSQYYQKLTPVAGGNYDEGVVGTYTNANPLFATTRVDTTVSGLLFPGLFKYDQNNNLVGNLAQSWAVNSVGTVYTVILKDNLKWQDGTPITASDVVFTYDTIQDPDVQSPLLSSWYGVKVAAVNANTISFTLPDPLSSFPYDLTNGIIPEHVLKNIPPADLRSAQFNTVGPIGSGPFKMSGVEVLNSNPEDYEIDIALSANSDYYGGTPKLNGFNVYAFNNSNQMIASFESGGINAMVGLNSLPAKLANNPTVYTYNIPETGEVNVFFRTNQSILSDLKVREALVEGINESQVIATLGYPVVPAKGPLLPFQIGYNSSTLELPTNIPLAQSTLTADGWLVGNGGIRYKAGVPLSFVLTTEDNSEFNSIANNLAAQWQKIGVDLQVQPLQLDDLDNAISAKSYDAILYGISIGVDPDVFVYWDSSQAQPNSTPGLNLSLYQSAIADESLEQGRTRLNPQLRAIKYLPFLQTWQTDAPALTLYQPRFLYVTRGQLFGFNPTMINAGTDRFANVQNWEIREIKTTD